MTRQNTAASDGAADEHTPLTHASSSLGNMGSIHPNHVEQSGDSKPLYKDDRAWVRWPANFFHLMWQTLSSNYVNVLLVFVPAGIVLGALDMSPMAVFIVNFLAIVPLAALLSFATEELSAKLGQTIGGLMNATFGNAVELIVSVAGEMSGSLTLIVPRSPSLRSRKARSASSKPACLVLSCRTSFSSWVAASLHPASGAQSRASTRPSHRPCPP